MISTNNSYRSRRIALSRLLPGKVLVFHNGVVQFRNLTASGWPFRGNSHVLYFFGSLPARSVALLADGQAYVFAHIPSQDEAVWEGEGVNWSELKARYALDKIRPLEELAKFLESFLNDQILTVPSLHPEVNQLLENLLQRKVCLEGQDRLLAEAIVELRLIHDESCQAGLKEAAFHTQEAFLIAMRQTSPQRTGYEILSALEGYLLSREMRTAFSSIVTTAGEVLHNDQIGRELREDSLLLVDFGAETPSGFAGDVTRVWPVGGRFSSRQRLIYEIVLESQIAALNHVAPGVEFFEVHLMACRRLLEGLISLKLLRGSVDSLLERGAHTLFFPHGIGHLLGLDAHDMEDLGDLAGYFAGRRRDSRFGFNFLRLHRPLRAGMCVTIEPGFYWIPTLLRESPQREAFRDCLCLEEIAKYQSVRGIRIEDDVLVTQDGFENITSGIPKSIDEIEAVVGADARSFLV